MGSLSRRAVIEVWPIGMHGGPHARRCRAALRPICFPTLPQRLEIAGKSAQLSPPAIADLSDSPAS
ncbi:hypothetical protein DGN02_06355 [Xanthomonas citri]|nr:hypothetical protein DGN02_06355 [Xanthomonas citri]